MNLDKKQKRLLVLLAVLLAYFIFDFAKNKDEYLGYYSKKKIVAKVNPPKKKTPVAVAPKKSKKPVQYTQNWGNDPFYEKISVRRKRRVVKSRAGVKLWLKAISYNGESSVAMINNRVMMKGDVISGFRVVDIQPRKVTLAKGGQRRILNLK